MFGGKTRVNSGGISMSVEIDTHAPPVDKLFSIPRCQGDPSSNFSLTMQCLGSRTAWRRSIGTGEKRGKDVINRSPRRNYSKLMLCTTLLSKV